MNEEYKSFSIQRGKGFHVVFPNGYRLSTQFGPGNYCENKDEPFDQGVGLLKEYQSNDAEIAIFNSKGEWVTKRARTAIEGKREGYQDDVEGWLTIKEWLKYFNWTATRRRAHKVKD